jgi:energy-coupling factor transporter ATP-binding protein EcfA2
LSGGDAQRLKLTAYMGSVDTLCRNKTLSETLFVFDEPTIGLHPLDIQILLKLLRNLINKGASIIISEHDLDVMRASDWMIELIRSDDGGCTRIVTGTSKDLCEKHTPTGCYLGSITEAVVSIVAYILGEATTLNCPRFIERFSEKYEQQNGGLLLVEQIVPWLQSIGMKPIVETSRVNNRTKNDCYVACGAAGNTRYILTDINEQHAVLVLTDGTIIDPSEFSKCTNNCTLYVGLLWLIPDAKLGVAIRELNDGTGQNDKLVELSTHIFGRGIEWFR